MTAAAALPFFAVHPMELPLSPPPAADSDVAVEGRVTGSGGQSRHRVCLRLRTKFKGQNHRCQSVPAGRASFCSHQMATWS